MEGTSTINYDILDVEHKKIYCNCVRLELSINIARNDINNKYHNYLFASAQERASLMSDIFKLRVRLLSINDYINDKSLGI